MRWKLLKSHLVAYFVLKKLEIHETTKVYSTLDLASNHSKTVKTWKADTNYARIWSPDLGGLDFPCDCEKSLRKRYAVHPMAEIK